MDHRHLAFVMASALLAAACAKDESLSAFPDSTPPDEQPPDAPLPPPTMKGPPPELGPTVTQTDAPPPLSGGTLAITPDGKLAVAADPDRDRVFVVTLATKTVAPVELQKHDEPGRVALDASGRAHVVLRGGGAVATIDLATNTLVARRAVCPAPRGIAFDAAASRMLVACEGGSVVALGADPSAVVATPFASLDRDLRDVVVSGTRIFVSRFRSAQVLELDANGALVTRTQLDGSLSTGGTAVLAWRMIAPPEPNGAPILVHESATSAPVKPAPGGYGGGSGGIDDCSGGSIVTSVVSRNMGSPINLPDHAVLPVDVVFDGSSFAVVAAGNAHTPTLPQVFVLLADVQRPSNGPGPTCTATHLDAHGQLTSIALRPITSAQATGYIVQSREPAQLEILPDGIVIPLATGSREDTGHAIFHSNSGSGIACASCHGEGGDDGHVWTFAGSGARRTPSLRGTLQDTAPYHWGGEMKDISMLVDDVMTGRMNGPSLEDAQKNALQSWLFALPGPVAPVQDPAAVDRGRALFESADVGCTRCHSGPRFTNAMSIDVGTGGTFQVPSLVGVGARAPYMHDGCATTLTDRFGPCGGVKHGATAQLSKAQIADLVSYLGTL